MIYNNIVNAILGSHLAATPEYVGTILSFTEMLSKNSPFTGQFVKQEDEDHDFMKGAMRIGKTGSASVILTENGTAIVPIQGMITPKATGFEMCMNGTSMDKLTARINELAQNGEVENVVLNIHSGGGSVLGVPEAADAIRRLSAVKPVTASINMVAGSAAYWLASAANRILITKSGIAGSIGVFAIVANQAEKLKEEGIDARIIRAGKFKAMPNGIEAFTEDDPGLALIQKNVNRIHAEFKEALSLNLNITMTEVDKLADGTTKTGQEAIDANLADAFGDLNDAIETAAQTELRTEADETTASVEEDVVTGVTEERAEEISASITEDIEEIAAMSDEDVETALAESEDFEALKAENEELKARLDELEKASAESAKSAETEKINAVIATATKDGRIAPLKAEEMTELAHEIGFDKFEAMIEAIPVPSVVEDLTTAPPKAEEDTDEYAPSTEFERSLYARSHVLSKKYNLK